MNKEQELEHLKAEHIKDLNCIEALTEEVDRLNELLNKSKLDDLEAKKEELEKSIADERYRIFMNTVRQPLVNEEQKAEEPKAKSLDELLMED